jgi:hypothetical protein
MFFIISLVFFRVHRAQISINILDFFGDKKRGEVVSEE